MLYKFSWRRDLQLNVSTSTSNKDVNKEFITEAVFFEEIFNTQRDKLKLTSSSFYLD